MAPGPQVLPVSVWYPKCPHALAFVGSEAVGLSKEQAKVANPRSQRQDPTTKDEDCLLLETVGWLQPRRPSFPNRPWHIGEQSCELEDAQNTCWLVAGCQPWYPHSDGLAQPQRKETPPLCVLLCPEVWLHPCHLAQAFPLVDQPVGVFGNSVFTVEMGSKMNYKSKGSC